MPFLLPNQQRQSTEGTSPQKSKNFLGGGTGPMPDPSVSGEGKNTEIKHNNQLQF